MSQVEVVLGEIAQPLVGATRGSCGSFGARGNSQYAASRRVRSVPATAKRPLCKTCADRECVGTASTERQFVPPLSGDGIALHLVDQPLRLKPDSRAACCWLFLVSCNASAIICVPCPPLPSSGIAV